MKTLKSKFIVLFAVFTLVSVISFLFLFKTISAQKADGLIVNIAGRQRMLAQKFTKEFFDGLIPNQVRHSALNAAKIATIQITEDRAKYTKAVIGKLKKELKGFSGSRNWSNTKGAVPLPATFVQEVSDKINQTGVYRYDLLSRWNINKDKGLNDRFEEEAFDYIKNNKEEPYYKFLEYKGQFVIRYATADIAAVGACINCHNSHPNSPKKDFRLGDVMGILIVTVPISKDVALGSAMFAGNNGQGGGSKLNNVKSYDGTKKIFEKSMSALMTGGDLPLDLAMTKFKEVSATNNKAIISQLQNVNVLWEEMQNRVNEIETSEINSASYLSAFMKLRKINLEVVGAMNKAVGMYEGESAKKMANLQKLQVVSLLVTVGAVLFGWLLFIRPLISLLTNLIMGIREGSDQINSSAT